MWTVSGQQQQEQHKKRCSLHIFYAHAAFDVRRPFLPFYTLSLPPEFIHSFFSKEREGEAGCKKGKKRPLSPPQYRGFAKNVSEVTQWSQMINAFIFCSASAGCALGAYSARRSAGSAGGGSASASWRRSGARTRLRLRTRAPTPTARAARRSCKSRDAAV